MIAIPCSIEIPGTKSGVADCEFYSTGLAAMAIGIADSACSLSMRSPCGAAPTSESRMASFASPPRSRFPPYLVRRRNLRSNSVIIGFLADAPPLSNHMLDYRSSVEIPRFHTRGDYPDCFVLCFRNPGIRTVGISSRGLSVPELSRRPS